MARGKATKRTPKKGAGRKDKTLIRGFSLPKAPRRRQITEPAARTFEDGPKQNVSRLRRDDRGDRVAAYLPPEMAQALRVCCAQQRRSVSDAMTEAVADWLSQQPH